VGSVVAALAAQGVERSTYVVFLSDNGLFLGEHRLGDKRLAYEESLRVPLVFAGGDVTAHRVQAMALNLDLAPTIVDLAGVPVPANMQGRSLAPILRGGSLSPRDSFLYEYMAEGAFPVVPDIVGIRLAQLVSAAYRPDQRGISLEEFVPRLLVAVPGTCHQCGDRSGTRNSSGVRLPCFAVALLVPQLPLAGVCPHLTAVLAGELAGDVGVH